MGAKIPKSIGDYVRYGFDLGVECDRCGRIAVFCAREAYAWERHLLAVQAGRRRPLFRCKCGATSISIRPVDRACRPSAMQLPPPPLRPLYILRQARLNNRLRSVK